jgi:hypothetical protein
MFDQLLGVASDGERDPHEGAAEERGGLWGTWRRSTHSSTSM